MKMFHMKLHKNILSCYREICRKLVPDVKLTRHRVTVHIATPVMPHICANGARKTRPQKSSVCGLYAGPMREFIRKGVKLFSKIAGVVGPKNHRCTMKTIPNHLKLFGFAEGAT